MELTLIRGNIELNNMQLFEQIYSLAKLGQWLDELLVDKTIYEKQQFLKEICKVLASDNSAAIKDKAESLKKQSKSRSSSYTSSSSCTFATPGSTATC